MTTIEAMPAPVLSDDLLERCAGRAATYDRENRFFSEDFEELREAGYLLLPVPRELGGLGYNLAEICKEQRKLAYRSPATALATNMHFYWVGLAADMLRMGDLSMQWMLEEAAAGEVFAAGHGVAGNDLPVLMSSAGAERAVGGYQGYALQLVGSLAAVWRA